MQKQESKERIMADSTIVRWTFIIVLGQVQNHKGWSEAYRQAQNYWIRVKNKCLRLMQSILKLQIDTSLTRI